MGKNKRTPKQPPSLLHLHDKKPMTRRDLLSAGVIQFAASMTLPSLITQFARVGVAEAQDVVCPKGNTSGLPPMVFLGLAGGAAMAANFIPRDQGGLFLPDYSRLGMGTVAKTANRTDIFANPAPFYTGGNQSGMMLGMLATNPMIDSLKKTTFLGVCTRSNDDNSTTKWNWMGMADKAGYRGLLLPNLSSTGTPRYPTAIASASAPLAVGSFADLAGALNATGALGNMTRPQQEKLFEISKNLTNSQAAQVNQFSGGQRLIDRIFCAMNDNRKVASTDVSNLDPLNSPLAAIWNLNANTSKASRDYVFAALILNLLNGNAGSINLEIGGYDYHNGTRTTGDAKDNEAGVTIKRILDSFQTMGSRGVLLVASDGAVGSNSSDPAAPWGGDRGAGGSGYLMMYDPIKAPEAMDNATQIGYFSAAGQAADEKFVIGGDAQLGSAAAMANVFAFAKRTDLIQKVIPGVFSDSALKEIIKIAG